MHNSIDVAYRMLQLAKVKGIQLSNLQLQKLVYIAHGYLLGWKGKPLFTDDVSAWKYGPVIEPIYRHFKGFKAEKIELPHLDEIESRLDEDAEQVMKGVLDLYGKESAVGLVNITHQKDTPWDVVWNEQKGSKHLFATIPDEIIREHYLKVISNPAMVNGL